MDRSTETGKTRGGGVCIFINNAWCNNVSTITKHCSPALEFLIIKCRPFYLPWEFTSVIITAVYIAPDANGKEALEVLHIALNKQENAHPDATFIVAGDFDQTNLKSVLPKYHQHVSFPTRGENTLDHVYTKIQNAYNAYRPLWGLQIRLDGSSCSGRVQVESEGQWGSVCSHSWDLRDAEVVCKQLGCGAAMSAPHLAHPQTAPEDRVLNKVGCLGNETELGECRAGRLGSKDCQLPWDAGAICAAKKRIRMAKVASSCSGRLEVYYRGQWGTVCETDWGLNESHVVCRQAGCGEAQTYSKMRILTNDVPIWLDRVHCNGNESSLWECSSDPWGHHECDYSTNVHIICIGSFTFSLTNGNSPCAGRLEMKSDLATFSFLDEHIHENVGNVLCNELKCGSIVSVKKQAYFGQVASSVWNKAIECKGNESTFWQCYTEFLPTFARHDEFSYAGLICFNHREPRIVGGEDPCSGRVEVQFGDEWGTLCDSGWDLQDASVVCRQLQCGEAVAIPGGARYGEGKGPVWDKQLDCQGNESLVFECPVSTEKTQNCSHRNYASVVCSGQEGPRLVGGESRCAGRVEVLRGSQWGSFCEPGLEWQTAEVICRHLQCGGVKATPRGAPYGVGSVPLWKDRYQCSGREGHLGDCPVSWGKEECEQGSIASVVCSDHWRVRLAGGESLCAGRVEVYHRGAWGSVCDDFWDLADVSVVCRQLGCGHAVRASVSAEFGEGSGPVWMDTVKCEGNESALWNCPGASLEKGNCGHKEDAGMICSEHKQLRLVSAEYDCAGRLEVLYNGTWGSVCSNGMDSFTIDLICKQLQCGDSGTLQDGQQYESGSGPKWLDNVKCLGQESVLWQCSSSPWGQNKCQDSEVAEIQCLGEN
ncbi:C163A protein, partial [Atractosteus spatula]|nr:C163A protein [Atractosteus spatula]